ncbi:3-dehydroquinate synthase [Flavobacterium selenitireducens]|uniref:3-dehydroquinate synthase n=1 Tax=Flavobacterium selenitireducens TaxID=2722704 RepID=UPI00168B9D53|nr:3-dehydroquinate synthase [Flavobacterium selenitireducens]MBD3583035.1 3-dehydroquinate synthase [Flavobacterium selenitireducens]
MQAIPANGYQIVFSEEGYSALSNVLAQNRYSKIFILTDTNSNASCLPHFLGRLETQSELEILEIEPGEAHKSIATCVSLWNVLTEYGADRKCVIINLGGGVITDLGGFVAATYKRGVDFIHVPTTLLAMVDASVGGKNGVDLGSLKNQVGTITTPRLLLVDTHFLSTLPQNQMRSGLAEMLKHGLIYDKPYWEKFLDLSQIDFADFDALVYRSIEIKNEIVTRDPTEKGMRKALNFGHTLGHAIESHFLESEHKTTLLHGEAISAGMILEAFLSMETGLLSESEYVEIKTAISDVFGLVEFEPDDLDAILELLKHDKKNEYGNILFALIDGIGSAKIDQQVQNTLILKAFDAYKS